jgi:hypothetical protein
LPNVYFVNLFSVLTTNHNHAQPPTSVSKKINHSGTTFLQNGKP